MDNLDPNVARHLTLKKCEERIDDINNQIWIPDEMLGYRLVTVIDEGLSDVLVGFRDDQGFFEKKRIDKKDCQVPSLNNYSDDLCTLTQPNAATVLHALNLRYTNNVIHTYCGLFCVVINPWKNIPIYSDEIKSLYQNCCEMPPHVYTVAQNTLHGILKGGRNQSILITGESGAGKTENTKKIIDFILKSSGSNNTIGEHVVTSGVILEALGNAKTVHNNNSSRFGKFIRIEFDEDSKLIGGKIECSARQTLDAFNKIGFSEEEKIWMFQVLSAIIWIGDIKFGERSGMDLSFVESMQEVNNIAELLELKSSKLVDALTQPTIRVHDKLIRKNQNLAKTLNSASAMAKVLYERLFSWVVQKCNDAFSVEDTGKNYLTTRFIAVLDIAGFEIVDKNSFEQFCINYTNEKLQQFFNHFMFVKEQSDYLDEGIKWNQVNFANHLQPTIDLIEKPMGILSLLEEECVVPNGSEKSLLDKLCQNLEKNDSFKKAKQTQRCSTIRHFSIRHYAGEVDYNIDGWLDKNRDNVENSVLEILSQSTQPLLKILFPSGSATANICADVGMKRERFAIGKSKFFAKVGVISELEKQRNNYISGFVIQIQAIVRYNNAQKDCIERRMKMNAISTIQQNVRQFAELSQWPWYRIYTLSRGLIPRNREKKRIEELEGEKKKLLSEIEVLNEQYEQRVKENSKLFAQLDAEKKEKDRISAKVQEIEIESRKKIAEKEREFRKTLEDMEQNEEIFNVLEKKYDEQRKKVMKMNDVLRDYERKIEQLTMTNNDIEAENIKLKELANRNSSMHDELHKELAEKTSNVDSLQAQVQRLLQENNEQKLTIAKLENSLEDEKARMVRLNGNIGDLQKLVTELNDKIARLDGVALGEKNATRKIEREKERLNDELNAAKDVIQKQAKKIDDLKDECRNRANIISKLEKKLEDKEAMMADCVKELKTTHKERVKELEQKVEEVKRKNSKLENENTSQKSQIEQFQRESSVDSDYGRSSSGRLSNIGRQYSLTSIGSFSSIRTIGLRRKDSESDMSASMYSLRRRDSLYDSMSQSVTSPPSLQRSPSTSQVMEKERRIMELEREKAAINTDLQLVKRELDVYKSQLSAVESEKESLQQTVRKQATQIQEVTRQFNSAEKNADSLALRLKKAIADCDEWKRKHENSIRESKDEILAERRRALERAEASEKETELKFSRIATIENAKTELSAELARTQSELDRCRAIISQLEENIKSQETLGDSFESQQRNMNFEIESLRDENCALKAKIRRQYKQIELLTQQDETNDELNHFENKIDKFLS
ncbi:unnamed protein product [Caenorhabditis bovis]|uniref:Myosin motor domain-containing protein n=1 Tax=Caenorhabditis bovis TaxID=2654633 RepID=A0A8S1EPH1_9PELO|nr:unnamed protein product [Caenorhabditis bovis]